MGFKYVTLVCFAASVSNSIMFEFHHLPHQRQAETNGATPYNLYKVFFLLNEDHMAFQYYRFAINYG